METIHQMVEEEEVLHTVIQILEAITITEELAPIQMVQPEAILL